MHAHSKGARMMGERGREEIRGERLWGEEEKSRERKRGKRLRWWNKAMSRMKRIADKW